MKKSCLIALLAGMLLFSQKTLGVSFVVSPAKVNTTLSADAPTTQVFTVQNNSAVSVRFKAYLEDWTITTTGADTFLEPGSVERSCAPWITINPVEFEVPAGAHQKVRVSFNAPREAVGGYWCIFYIETEPIPSKWSEVVSVNGRIGVKIFGNITDTEVRGCEIVALRIEQHSRLELTAVVRNTGNVPLWLTGEVQIKDSMDKMVWEEGLSHISLLPGLEHEIRRRPGIELGPGEYRAIVTIDYGGEEIVQGERRMRVE